MLKMNLLNSKFKLVGLSIIILTILIIIIPKLFSFDVKEKFQNGKSIVQVLIIFGMFLIIISKNKIEDERIVLLRLRAFFYSFIFAIITALLNLIFKLEIYNSEFSLIFKMCIIYLSYFYFPDTSWRKNEK